MNADDSRVGGVFVFGPPKISLAAQGGGTHIGAPVSRARQMFGRFTTKTARFTSVSIRCSNRGTTAERPTRAGLGRWILQVMSIPTTRWRGFRRWSELYFHDLLSLRPL